MNHVSVEESHNIWRYFFSLFHRVLQQVSFLMCLSLHVSAFLKSGTESCQFKVSFPFKVAVWIFRYTYVIIQVFNTWYPFTYFLKLVLWELRRVVGWLRPPRSPRIPIHWILGVQSVKILVITQCINSFSKCFLKFMYHWIFLSYVYLYFTSMRPILTSHSSNWFLFKGFWLLDLSTWSSPSSTFLAPVWQGVTIGLQPLLQPTEVSKTTAHLLPLLRFVGQNKRACGRNSSV